jgi:hypothetical protein
MFKSFLTIRRCGIPSKHRVPIAFTTCGHHVEHCVVSSMLQHLQYTSTRWLPMKTSSRQPISIICSWRTFHAQVLLHWHLHQQPTNSDWIWFQPLPIALIEKAWIPFTLALFSCIAKWWQCKKPHWVHLVHHTPSFPHSQLGISTQWHWTQPRFWMIWLWTCLTSLTDATLAQTFCILIKVKACSSALVAFQRHFSEQFHCLLPFPTFHMFQNHGIPSNPTVHGHLTQNSPTASVNNAPIFHMSFCNRCSRISLWELETKCWHLS